jgi:hypothetical protein
MRPLLLIWLVAFLSLTNLSPVHSSSPFQQEGSSISAQEYWDLVGSTRQAVAQLKSQTDAKVTQELNTLASQWDLVSAVELPDGTVMQIHSEYLTGELRSASPDLDHLEKSLDTLLKAHQEYPQEVFTIQDIDPLKKILARPEFQWDQGRTMEMPAWLGNIFDAITKFTDRIVFAIVNLLVQGRSIFIVVGSILFTLILLYISRLLSRNLAGNAQLGAQGEEGEGIVTSQGALQRAQALSSQGDYRTAVRFLYLSSLLVLDEQGLLRYDRSRTNREVLRSVSSRPDLADPLRDVIDVFDRVWYGYEPVDEQTYQAYREHVEELREKKE